MLGILFQSHCSVELSIVTAVTYRSNKLEALSYTPVIPVFTVSPSVSAVSNIAMRQIILPLEDRTLLLSAPTKRKVKDLSLVSIGKAKGRIY